MEKLFQLYTSEDHIDGDIYKIILPDMLEVHTLDSLIAPKPYQINYKGLPVLCLDEEEYLTNSVLRYLHTKCQDFYRYKITLLWSDFFSSNRLEKGESVIGYGILEKGFRLYLTDCCDPFDYYITSTIESIDNNRFKTKNSLYEFTRYEHTDSKQIK